MIGQRLSHFEITEKLGEGGMGEVWRARDSQLDRDVAIKILPEAFTQDEQRLGRFEREAKLLAQLNHANIAQIYGLESSGETRALVLELVEGPTLDERLRQTPMGLDETLSVARQIALALEQAHERGIIHRDLKPQNVKLTADGEVKVLDFGLAKAMDPGESGASSPQYTQSPTLTLGATVQGVILGTAAYMAPEQAAGAVADRRSDIWSFGVVLFEMLSGKRLFDGESVPHVLAGVLKEEPDFSLLPADVPPRIERLLRRCLRKKPRERLQAIGDARIVIDEVLAGDADERVPQESTVVTRSRPLWQIAAALAGAVALGALGALAFFGRPEPWHRLPRTVSDISFPDLTRATEPALSPDGTQLAFSARGAEGGWGIRIRNMASGEIRAVPGNGVSPFWSPDGTSLGYYDYTADEVARFDLVGGRPTGLAECAGIFRMGTWGTDAIVFSCEGSLYRVSPTGGDQELLMERTETVTYRGPNFVVDGRSFTFQRHGERGTSLFVGSLDGGEPRELVASESPRTGVDRGRLFYLRGDTLLARPFDSATGQLGPGEPSIVVEGVGTRWGGLFSVAPGLVVFAGSGAESGSRVVVYDRTGTVVSEIDSDTFLSDVDVSPDGRYAVIMKNAPDSGSGSGANDVWTLDLERRVFNRVTYGEDDDDGVFSPDGRQIAYAHDGDVYVMSADGTGEPKLIAAADDAVVNDWTQDGQILYDDVIGSGLDLFAVAAEGGEPRQLTTTQFRESHAQVSPDGRWLAYSSEESGEPQVYLTSWPELSGKWRVSTESASMPRWREDGGELLFMTRLSRAQRATIEVRDGVPLIGLPDELFASQMANSYGSRKHDWGVTPDGERFIVIESPLDGVDRSPSFVLISNP